MTHSKTLFLLGALASFACAKPPASPESSAGAPSPVETASPEIASSPESETATATTETTSSESGVESSVSASASSEGNMPATVGVGTSTVSGCLASKDGTEQAPREGTRAAQGNPAPVTVSAVSGGVRIVQELAHACCLESKTETAVKGKVVTVRVALSGTPCRCMCSSQVLTNVRLSPGEYTVRVSVDDRGQKKADPDQKIMVH